MLTVKQIDAAKPKDKPYRISDGNGLYVYIPVSGKKVWQLRYQFEGKEKIHTVGKYPEIGPAEARNIAFEVKRDLAIGLNPAAKKKQQEKVPDTFGSIYEEWYKHKRQVWSEGYAVELQRMFEADILPYIGKMTIDDIEPMTLLKVLRRFEERGAMERANKARRRCGEVFRYAVVTGRAKYNPAPDLADAMKGYRKKNFPFLPAEQIPAFNRALAGYSGSIVSKIATQVLQYTAMRTKELRSMQWANVDFENRVITIDAEVMKNRKQHLVPMSRQVYDLLRQLQPITSISDFVFAGRNDKKKSISENAVLLVIRQIGYEGLASGHGFRHQFSTILNEHGWPHDAIERQLAHVDRNNIRGIYNHAQYLEKRKEMMQWWADYIDGTAS
ncbi:tyrosine-type recombinase/integrase [Cronobacter malonaticus]|uniref:tyrosine-type recombinase/integrase n=1 Tax=Cronobacter malonaticus TaxID=413503 RepID=UPI000A10D433|nr:tyrosine-type recombinase/integrase [Cronobacter malonaticus]ELY5933852.1 tyrosine-type recombinase/integrase [Cronobacter malonaticus]MDK1178416.1 tyrosine-type recombinase/integrase [Cronobacter malonaticus]MDK1687865.1 tyrosine-type recombinase/integrase [Cronobacter malonaticus]MDT3600059.1 tyrosine-type recombinase/integrase [Cronobacter malonaticus]MDT3642911.1 tyrosine-type recombinase/integrase [Cronobacter malonaticus]